MQVLSTADIKGNIMAFIKEVVAKIETIVAEVETPIIVKAIEAPHPNPIIALAIAQAAERLANETK